MDERRLGVANLTGWGTSFSRILKREPERGADDVVRVVLAAEVHIVEHRGTRENFFQKKIRSPRKCPTGGFRMPAEMITRFLQKLVRTIRQFLVPSRSASDSPHQSEFRF